MGILSENQDKEPMHYGEVFGIWTYIFTAKNTAALYQTFINHIGDKKLRELLKVSIQHIKDEIKLLEDVLYMNEVELPPAPPERLQTIMEKIPARMNDPEMNAVILKDISAGLIACSVMIGQSIREDIANLFAQLHRDKAQFGAQYLLLSKDKGWLVPPPLHNH